MNQFWQRCYQRKDRVCFRCTPNFSSISWVISEIQKLEFSEVLIKRNVLLCQLQKINFLFKWDVRTGKRHSVWCRHRWLGISKIFLGTMFLLALSFDFLKLLNRSLHNFYHVFITSIATARTTTKSNFLFLLLFLPENKKPCFSIVFFKHSPFCYFCIKINVCSSGDSYILTESKSFRFLCKTLCLRLVLYIRSK